MRWPNVRDVAVSVHTTDNRCHAMLRASSLCNCYVLSAEYGLTEASTGISVGSQPPLLIPSTHVSDTPLFSALPDALSPPLMRTNGTPPSGPSPTASRRLSWVGPENASSVDSTTSGGMCDANIHSIDEDRIRGRCASEGGKYGNQGRGYSASLTEGDANSNHNDSVVKQLDRTPICDSETSKSEDKKVGFFFRTFSLREKGSERQRTKSSDEAVTGVVRRSLREKDFNTVPRRRSLIDRISSRSSSEEKPSRRRSLQILKPIVKEEPRDQTQHDAVTAPQTHKQSTQVRLVFLPLFVFTISSCFHEPGRFNQAFTRFSILQV